MKKNCLILLVVFLCFAGKSSAQVIYPCATVDRNEKYKQQNPKIADYEKQLEEEIAAYIKYRNNPTGAAYRTTSVPHADTDWYDIPMVIHIVHNGGPELIADNKVYELIEEMNDFYSLNFNNSAVVPQFKQYIGKPKFRFHLATKDPNGNPTNGITHRLSYLTYGYDDQAKMDQWPPTSYANIWFEYVIGTQVSNGIIVAYTELPPSAAGFPQYDGIISNYQFINDGGTPGPTNTMGGSIDHEMGHFFNLLHTFGNTNTPHTNTEGNCLLDDGVDDTPPCEGNLGGCNLYDTICSTNYFKVYTNISGGDSLVNYPDTANEQNIMNYADCKNMFTKGQVWRMRGTLNSSVAGRNNLWDTTNLINTGVWDANFNPIPKLDLKPNPEFVITPGTGGNTTNTNYMDRMGYFVGPGTNVTFHSTTWNDTVTALNWTFSNGATNPTSASTTTVSNAFTTPGWVTVTMTATGNNTGDTTATWTNALYVANTTGTPASSFAQDFSPANSGSWPTFNYYGNGFKWQIANTGLYDNYSMEYVGYDSRYNPATGLYPSVGTPLGDFDDMFTTPVDFTGYIAGNASLNFDYSGASRSSTSLSINDTLDIDYSINKGQTWANMAKIGKRALDNMGAVATPYAPSSASDWAHQSLAIPSTALTNYTLFRFRYKPNVDQNGQFSSGNNFYMDNVNVRPWPASVGGVTMNNADIIVVPNPTNGDAYVMIKNAENTIAKIIVSDITGKVVYTASQQINTAEAYVQIPQSAISVKGMYIVQSTTGTKTNTQKLVVY